MSERLSLFRNYISMAGAAVAAACLASILLLFLVDITGRRSSPYIGIFAWIIIPSILICSIIAIAIGAIRERRRRKALGEDATATRASIDLSDPHGRKVFLIFVGVAFLFVCVSAFGSYQAYEQTESVAFCGQTCHTVMNPQFVAFQNSPHARLECVDCHVGEGARWYVKAKLNGLHQLYAVTFNTFERPIRTPVANMRPANDTCAHCHWNERFIGTKLKTFDRFAYDQNNTHREIRMLIDVGGGNPATGPVRGIHWHMNLANEITFIATDRQRQSIPWIQSKDGNGNVTVYVANNSQLTPEQINTAPRRVMDCIDCHSRPAHIFNPPDSALDRSFAANRLDASLPFLKREAVAALSKPYKTNDEAVKTIASTLDNFYRTNYADIYSSKKQSVDGAIKETQRIYQRNFFPEMKTDWQASPNNIGHLTSSGCFRCHDGEHKSNTGKVIRNDCNLCHTVLSDSERPPEQNPRAADFKHPIDLGSLSSRRCETCHIANKPFVHPVNLGDISMFPCAECHH
jgi:nitrate/TMAO reductase-like tetraheme cytochrome c subunit